ncbi:hypothetical protein FRX31_018970 [Thalictrum thalictroides]|uniref:Uncharacterized protein n=1 Tax=Thalictrum thalictroides TaxID=46969 RepID=A0A7J6W2X7_THATH|nr:hypothetical protein FRX31_018970 [Thalictrum thalictroides]
MAAAALVPSMSSGLQLYKKIPPNESIIIVVAPELIEEGHLPDHLFLMSSEKSVYDLKLMMDKQFSVPQARQLLKTMDINAKDELALRDYIIKGSELFLWTKKITKEKRNEDDSDNNNAMAVD